MPSAPPKPVFAGGREPDQLAAGLAHLPGLVWFDDPPGHGRWRGEWLAALPAEVRSGRWPGTLPPVPAPGEFWAGAMDYDGTWQFARYDRWLHRPTGAATWSDTGGLLRHWRDPGVGPAWVPPASCQAATWRPEFLQMVARAKEYIAAGDIYQVNLAHRFTASWDQPIDPLALFLRLRQLSPAPHSAFLARTHDAIASASPETFLSRRGSTLVTRPIKGTRPRGANPEEDARLADELAHSAKERAELIMITDLERNDLGRVAETGSVRVDDLCALESFAQVHHQVSTVSARLRPDAGWPEIWRAMFPGGSITGAPKIRAMEIIRELEPVPRGLYTGAIGWMLGPADAVFSIAIRTAVVAGAAANFHAGSGIVEGSDPAAEYLETLHKATGLALACGMPRIC